MAKSKPSDGDRIGLVSPQFSLRTHDGILETAEGVYKAWCRGEISGTDMEKATKLLQLARSTVTDRDRLNKPANDAPGQGAPRTVAGEVPAAGPFNFFRGTARPGDA